MYFLKTTISDFERPLNTSLEDSIHMPQNHNNRKRRRSGDAQVPNTSGSATATVRNIGTATIRRTSRDQSQLQQMIPTTMSNDDSEHFLHSSTWTRPTSSLSERVLAEPRVILPSQISGTGQQPSLTRGEDQQIKDRIRRGDFRAIVPRSQCEERQPEVIPSGKVLYSKSHQQSSEQPSLPANHEVGFAFTSHVGGHTTAAPTRQVRFVSMPGRRLDSDERPASPTLEHIRRLRADEQIRASTKQTTALNPTISEQPDRAAVPKLAITHDAKQAEMEKLVEAMAEMNIFRKLASTPTTGSKHPVAVPKSPMLNTANVAKDVAKVLGVSKNADKQQIKAEDLAQGDAEESQDSLASSASDDFEEVDIPAVDETDHNGATRKWYKGYRR